MGDMLGRLLFSKKVFGFLVGTIVTLLAKVGLDIDQTTLYEMLALVAAYVASVAFADVGKEAVAIMNGVKIPRTFGELMKGLFASSKFITLLIGLLVMLISKTGIDLPPEVVHTMINGLSALLLGKGIADFKKEAAKIQVKADNAPKAAPSVR